ncbi:FtsK/SpoIIIE domain-containing protein [Dictyobacter arantiisoli]|uniref:FtsK domain-containing protein n=1 Tax=Dictyobacter arantiisoli TaxID=2014874 RepID=A0A5A5TDT1_9CHLR|nr:FtsK/SpoIIIE domain-containing protein [Dictyobacter arantiisoli]GCF09700.1 hypothetical protein KDI_32640 [Dictyobacter arantiisoli]
MSYQQPFVEITRKARIKPDIPDEAITLPTPPVLPIPPQTTTFTIIFFSLAGMAVYGYVFTHLNTGQSSVYIWPFIAISGFMALSTLVTFAGQYIQVYRRSSYLLTRYQEQLQETEAQLRLLHWREGQAHMELNPPLGQYDFKSPFYAQLDIKPLLQHNFDEYNMGLWARKPEDQDFLHIRIGIERRPSTYRVHKSESNEIRIEQSSRIDAYHDYARRMVTTYTQLYTPLLIPIQQQNPIAIVGPGMKLPAARGLLHAMVSQIVYHHSPADVRIIVLAPRSQETAWQWATILPHTILYDPRQTNEQLDEANTIHACAIGTGAIMELLPILSRELGRRELLLEDDRQTSQTTILPQLVIVVDEFDAPGDLDQPMQASIAAGIPSSNPNMRLSISPLKRPEMALAISRGAAIGVSVLCTSTNPTTIPPSTRLLIDLTEEHPPRPIIEEGTPLLDLKKRKHSRAETIPAEDQASTPFIQQALVRNLTDKVQPSIQCLQIDSATRDDLRALALRMQSLRAASSKRLEMRTQIDLRMLFEFPIDMANYDPFKRWNNPLFRTPYPLLRIPIGLKIGDEMQYLDLINDGPHGLLIGQTGSGKSELIQTLLLSLTFTYRPTEVNFLLIDYKTGLALAPFKRLPHTIGFLPNTSSPALIQRFMTMLQAEISRREKLQQEGKRPPHLIIIIEGFTEMAKRIGTFIEELFTITERGNDPDIHLLLVAQRPEGMIGTRARDYVQYRLCLRCASPEHSREILRRPDAASLPASIPGRGYLLHGDNQLDLFQCARVTTPVPVTIAQETSLDGQAQLNALLSLPFKGK